MNNRFASVMDVIDVETFLICKSKDEGRQLAIQLAADLGLPAVEIVFIEHNGPGVRVRLRSTIHHPGENYGWLAAHSAEDAIY